MNAHLLFAALLSGFLLSGLAAYLAGTLADRLWGNRAAVWASQSVMFAGFAVTLAATWGMR
jgi:dipeptide/tripeptide permease